MTGLEFSKYHGTGNDFILVFDQEVTGAQAAQMCDRNFGVGADGVIVISPSEVSDFSFRLFNADGGEAEVSGNGLRCVGKFLYEKGYTTESSVKVQAAGEVKELELRVDGGEVRSVRVDMGPATDLGELELHGYRWRQVDTGNPHVVTLVDDVSTVPVAEVGPAVENDPAFPNRTNVHFIEVSGETIEARFWERGVGVTLACGTGSVAALVASGLKRATVKTEGGDLVVEEGPSGHIFLEGPAVHVFDGRLA